MQVTGRMYWITMSFASRNSQFVIRSLQFAIRS
jgi:hypothetical protein